jgi:hypothetical protein
MRVQDLPLPLLDYWAAKGLELTAKLDASWGCCVKEDEFCGGIYFADHDTILHNGKLFGMNQFKPSSDWAHGGPIIEREKIDVSHRDNTGKEFASCKAYCKDHQDDNILWLGEGKTILIAAMRAYVASKFGDEVEG